MRGMLSSVDSKSLLLTGEGEDIRDFTRSSIEANDRLESILIVRERKNREKNEGKFPERTRRQGWQEKEEQRRRKENL